jgi:hypothetical protein
MTLAKQGNSLTANPDPFFAADQLRPEGKCKLGGHDDVAWWRGRQRLATLGNDDAAGRWEGS